MTRHLNGIRHESICVTNYLIYIYIQLYIYSYISGRGDQPPKCHPESIHLCYKLLHLHSYSTLHLRSTLHLHFAATFQAGMTWHLNFAQYQSN